MGLRLRQKYQKGDNHLPSYDLFRWNKNRGYRLEADSNLAGREGSITSQAVQGGRNAYICRADTQPRPASGIAAEGPLLAGSDQGHASPLFAQQIACTHKTAPCVVGKSG